MNPDAAQVLHDTIVLAGSIAAMKGTLSIIEAVWPDLESPMRWALRNPKQSYVGIVRNLKEFNNPKIGGTFTLEDIFSGLFIPMITNHVVCDDYLRSGEGMIIGNRHSKVYEGRFAKVIAKELAPTTYPLIVPSNTLEVAWIQCYEPKP